jgi:hypothetical protein
MKNCETSDFIRVHPWLEIYNPISPSCLRVEI